MKIKFEKIKEEIVIIAEDSRYTPLELLGDKWKLENIQSIKQGVQQAIDDESMDDFTIESLSGCIWIFPDHKKAGVYRNFPQNDTDNKSLLNLTLPEVVEFLTLMEDFLKNK